MSAGPGVVGAVGVVAPVAVVYRLLTLPTLRLPPLPQSARISVISLLASLCLTPHSVHSLPTSDNQSPTPRMTPALGHQATGKQNSAAWVAQCVRHGVKMALTRNTWPSTEREA